MSLHLSSADIFCIPYSMHENKNAGASLTFDLVGYGIPIISRGFDTLNKDPVSGNFVYKLFP